MKRQLIQALKILAAIIGLGIIVAFEPRPEPDMTNPIVQTTRVSSVNPVIVKPNQAVTPAIRLVQDPQNRVYQNNFTQKMELTLMLVGMAMCGLGVLGSLFYFGYFLSAGLKRFAIISLLSATILSINGMLIWSFVGPEANRSLSIRASTQVNR